MRRVAVGLMILGACGPSAAYRGSSLRLPSPDEQEAPEPPPSTEPQQVPQTTPPRPAQREVPTPITTILDVTPTNSLLSCLKQYESGNGSGSNNQYQFDQATWEAAGGTGTPDNASVSEQDAVAQNWIDQGHLHQAWAAQRGRCF